MLRGRWGNVAHRLGEFSTSGENAQDNDLIVIHEAAAAAQFEAHFPRMWEAARPIEFEPAIKTLEPK